MTNDLQYNEKHRCLQVSSIIYKFIRANQHHRFHYIDGIVLLNEFVFGTIKYKAQYFPGCFYPFLMKMNGNNTKQVKYSKAFEKYFQ